jgi:hypothetical protein
MIFFKNRRKLRAFFGILTSIFLFLVVLLSGPVMSVENSESTKNLVPALLKNTDVRTSLSNKILDQISKGNTDNKVTKSIEVKHAKFVSAISSDLSSSATIAELQKDVQLGNEHNSSEAASCLTHRCNEQRRPPIQRHQENPQRS